MDFNDRMSDMMKSHGAVASGHTVDRIATQFEFQLIFKTLMLDSKSCMPALVLQWAAALLFLKWYEWNC